MKFAFIIIIALAITNTVFAQNIEVFSNELNVSSQFSPNSELSFSALDQTNYLENSGVLSFRVRNSNRGVGSIKAVVGAVGMPSYRNYVSLNSFTLPEAGANFPFIGLKYRFAKLQRRNFSWTMDAEGLAAFGTSDIFNSFSSAGIRSEMKFKLERRKFSASFGPEMFLNIQDIGEPLNIVLKSNPDSSFRRLWSNALNSTELSADLEYRAGKVTLGAKLNWTFDMVPVSAQLGAELNLGKGWSIGAFNRNEGDMGGIADSRNETVVMLAFSTRKRHSRRNFVPSDKLPDSRAVGKRMTFSHPEWLKKGTYEETIRNLTTPEVAGFYTLNFRYDNVHDGVTQTPRDIWASQQGVCGEQNRFVAETLKSHGYEAYCLDLQAPGMAQGHSTCVYRDLKTGKWCIQDYNTNYNLQADTIEQALKVYMPGYTKFGVYDPTTRKLIRSVKSKSQRALDKAIWGDF